MQWLTVAGVLLYLTRCNDAGVLKCHRGSEDLLCALINTEISSIQNLIERDALEKPNVRNGRDSLERADVQNLLEIDSSEEAPENQCLPGTAWESNCYICHCNQSGLAECIEGPSCIAENLVDPILCKPNSTFKRYKETCVCLENGQRLCAPQLQLHAVEKRTPIQILIERDRAEKVQNGRDPTEGADAQNLLEIDSSEEAQENQCLPGTAWESNCYICHCNQSGLAECIEGPSCIAENLVDPILCKPNSTFKRYKETCVCLENGQGLCALQLQQHTIEKRSPEEQQCIPGSTFKRECNTCHCLDGGREACTKRGCVDFKDIHKREIADVRTHNHVSKRSVCKPHSEFFLDCNPCKCAADGQSYSCTHNECLEGGEEANKEVEVFMETEGTDHVEQHMVCKPRSTFYVGCNTCRCNFQGTDYSCTNKPCPLPADVELFHELKVSTPKPTSLAPKVEAKSNSSRVVCMANRMFIKDCNTCWCNEDGTSYFCTRKVCIEINGEDGEDPYEELKLREIKKECTPNEVFEMDCNMCRCIADGKTLSCTRRACVKQDDKNTTSRSARALSNGETQKTCQPGQEFRMDCNNCLCDNEGINFSCTRIDCAALNNGGPDRTKRETTTTITVEQQCEPGSVFDRACNVCRCTADGQHAVCQLKRCNKEPDVTTEPSPAFRCTPGDQFRRDCNDCTCSADGKNVFCTLRLCDDPSISP